MRKSVTLGLLALLFGLLLGSTAVYAGNEASCEPLKDDASKGLYGLCIA